MASSINKGWSALEAAAESAATLVILLVGLLKMLSWEQCAQRNAFKMSQTQVSKRIDDWGETSSGRRQKATRSDRCGNIYYGLEKQ